MSHTLHVLYIDDDPQNLDTISRVLARQGYKVTTAKSGQEGLKVAEAHKPDIILLDILLPDMNGFDVCDEIRSRPQLKTTPVIALTASVMNGDRQLSLAAGFDGYLAKPIARLELFNAINRFVRQ